MTNAFAVERFLNVRAAGGPSFSPDGRFVAFLANTTGVSQLWQVPAEGGWPTQLTFTGESVRGAHYSPARHELIYSMDIGGNERTQLFHLHGVAGSTDHGLGDGWTSTDLSSDPKAIHTFGGWSRDGGQVAFCANRDDPSRFDLYVQPVAKDGGPIGEKIPPARLVSRGPGGYYHPVGWSPDDRSLLIRRAESNFNQELHVVDVARGAARLLTGQQGDVQYHSPRWSADGTAIFCASTSGGRDLNALVRIDVGTGRLSFLDTPDHEVEEVEVSRDGRWLAWLVNVGGRSELRLRDLATNRTRVAPGVQLGVVSQLTFAPDGNRLAFTFDGPRHNPDVWLWDLAAKKAEAKQLAEVRQLTHASRAGLPFGMFIEPELIHYKSFDGRQIPAWWYESLQAKAADSALSPAIVYPHGGPESQTRPAFNALFQYFLYAGYSILAPNVRGSSGHGTAYMNLDNTTKRMDSVADLAHAAYWIRDRQKHIDPKKLAVYGGSYGGFMVLAQVTNYPDLWAAAIDVVGIGNFVTFMEKTGAYRRAHREAEYGNLREHRAFFEKISPINHVDKIKCPMMVIHGANDPRVPVEEAEQIVAALKKRNIPVEYLRYEDEGHGLAKLKNRLDAYPKMVAFLDRYLK